MFTPEHTKEAIVITPKDSLQHEALNAASSTGTAKLSASSSPKSLREQRTPVDTHQQPVSIEQGGICLLHALDDRPDVQTSILRHQVSH